MRLEHCSGDSASEEPITWEQSQEVEDLELMEKVKTWNWWSDIWKPRFCERKFKDTPKIPSNSYICPDQTLKCDASDN